MKRVIKKGNELGSSMLDWIKRNKERKKKRHFGVEKVQYVVFELHVQVQH